VVHLQRLSQTAPVAVSAAVPPAGQTGNGLLLWKVAPPRYGGWKTTIRRSNRAYFKGAYFYGTYFACDYTIIPERTRIIYSFPACFTARRPGSFRRSVCCRRQHLAAAAYASHALPFEVFLLAMLLRSTKKSCVCGKSSKNQHSKSRCMIEKTGWLLDLYPDPHTGTCILWLLGEDGGRYRFFHLFPVTFYAAGPPARLRALWQYLKQAQAPVSLSRVQRRDLFQTEPVTVLKVDVQRPSDQPRLFNQVAQAFSDLTYYNADLQMTLRHAALFDSFSTGALPH
jgi:hypothetical protein